MVIFVIVSEMKAAYRRQDYSVGLSKPIIPSRSVEFNLRTIISKSRIMDQNQEWMNEGALAALFLRVKRGELAELALLRKARELMYRYMGKQNN